MPVVEEHIYRVLRLVRLQNEDGTDPVKELALSCKYVSFVRRPSELEIVPVNAFDIN